MEDDDRDDRRDEPRDSGDNNGNGGDAAEEGTKLYVGNLSYNTRERDLEDLFVKYGKVKDVRIATEPGGGRSKGFGFVTMYDEKDAKDAVDGTHGTEVDGRTLKVEISQNKPKGERRGDDRRRDDRGRGDRGGGGGNVCFDWQKGRCSRGSACKFSHSDAGGSGGGRGGGRDYDRGRGGRDYDRGSRRDRSRSRSRGRRDRSRDRYDDRGRDRSRDRRDRDRRSRSR